MEVVFISSNIQLWFVPLSLSLKFQEDKISGYRGISQQQDRWKGVWLAGGLVPCDYNTTFWPTLQAKTGKNLS
jgi:hypothetical protein